MPSANKRAVLGRSLTLLPPGGNALIDLKNSVVVDLVHDDWLTSCDEDALQAGTNLASLGNELIQFKVADALGPRRFRLSNLLRGRGGTEYASSRHEVGESFAMVDPAALARLELPISAVGTEAVLRPIGLGDKHGGLTVRTPVNGRALRPPSPVHLQARQSPAGDLELTWVRRSRLGWSWLDHADTQLGEAVEGYVIEITGSGGTIQAKSTTAKCDFDHQQLHAVGSKPWTCLVAQLGDHGKSETSTLIVTS